MTADIFQSRPTEDLCLKIKSNGSRDAKRRTLMPDVSDVVVIAPGDQTEPRDIVLSSHARLIRLEIIRLK